MSDEFKVQWSVSLPPVAQYAKGHMFNFRGETVDELNAIFAEVLDSGTVQKALEVAELLTGAQTVVQSVNSTPVETGESNNVTQLRTCAHGKREYKSGSSAKGPWSGWFCPLKKGDPGQCEVVWNN